MKKYLVLSLFFMVNVLYSASAERDKRSETVSLFAIVPVVESVIASDGSGQPSCIMPISGVGHGLGLRAAMTDALKLDNLTNRAAVEAEIARIDDIRKANKLRIPRNED